MDDKQKNIFIKLFQKITNWSFELISCVDSQSFIQGNLWLNLNNLAEVSPFTYQTKNYSFYSQEYTEQDLKSDIEDSETYQNLYKNTNLYEELKQSNESEIEKLAEKQQNYQQIANLVQNQLKILNWNSDFVPPILRIARILVKIKVISPLDLNLNFKKLLQQFRDFSLKNNLKNKQAYPHKWNEHQIQSLKMSNSTQQDKTSIDLNFKQQKAQFQNKKSIYNLGYRQSKFSLINNLDSSSQLYQNKNPENKLFLQEEFMEDCNIQNAKRIKKSLCLKNTFLAFTLLNYLQDNLYTKCKKQRSTLQDLAVKFAKNPAILKKNKKSEFLQKLNNQNLQFLEFDNESSIFREDYNYNDQYYEQDQEDEMQIYESNYSQYRQGNGNYSQNQNNQYNQQLTLQQNRDLREIKNQSFKFCAQFLARLEIINNDEKSEEIFFPIPPHFQSLTRDLINKFQVNFDRSSIQAKHLSLMKLANKYDKRLQFAYAAKEKSDKFVFLKFVSDNEDYLKMLQFICILVQNGCILFSPQIHIGSRFNSLRFFSSLIPSSIYYAPQSKI
ncbi:hypothetical protein PPERSA_00051 [Pseudocohnilembus persalinus]|uniref:Uncharacterized protein n=1 Tax=Pseudocohnilembus persalinus TaxID=266149 RepID=A0A0V0Q8S9_PSEPJ|nr:hypothetical protein PPERSA_00051 [Pseudocohnilembus persalinus]|eukprot:KRW98559.1 hypothetical protein PPERSA_00051 [Pseudocohnilembus persalinus]